jgi:hypothetical protein
VSSHSWLTRQRIISLILWYVVSVPARRLFKVPKRAVVTKAMLDEASYAVWNAFVDLIANSFYQELTPRQRPAQLVFRYESEVQNGGHLQFFVNSEGEHLEETVAALDVLGAACQARVLAQAVARWNSAQRLSPEGLVDYVAEEAKREFRDFDDAFSNCEDCEASLTKVLERHLAEHEDWYIVRK